MLIVVLEMQAQSKSDNCKWWPTRCNYFGLFIYS